MQLTPNSYYHMARSYYYGLPSRPLLVYRTGTPWKRPTGLEAYNVPKAARPVFARPIADVWDELGPQVHDYLDSVNVTWTTIDIVRFAEVEKDPGPPVLWIGVKPGSLSRKDTEAATVDCEGLLSKFKLTDVEVAFRESLFIRSAHPKLLKYVYSSNPTAGVRAPLTTALGLQIAAQDTMYAEGTGALYISESHDSEKVYILTARHVVFPRNAGSNELYYCTRTNRHHRKDILPGPWAFQKVLKSTMGKIGGDLIMVDHLNRQLDHLKTTEAHGDVDDVAEERTMVERDLKAAEASIKAHNQFHDETTKYWSEESQRVIGHIAYSPPISVGTGTERYTEDWALIELDHDKIDWKNFKGNVIELGTNIPAHEFHFKMSPAAPTFKYPPDRLFPLQGVIEEDELRRPQMRDAAGEPCLTVAKNGCTTGVTIGCATGIKSFVREYFPDGTHETSVEWAILPHDDKAGAFSAPGDSGAIIFDGRGRIGGLLTGGAGKTNSIDITYGTPFYWLMQRIKEHFPHAHLYQATA
ncbi:hypothetical protein F5146DRAFT_1110115 [Armillaria mellea]|nr:hypothetical protein F5146DRAFT_1110115 [Armillaria mellea]